MGDGKFSRDRGWLREHHSSSIAGGRSCGSKGDVWVYVIGRVMALSGVSQLRIRYSLLAPCWFRNPSLSWASAVSLPRLALQLS